jgi:hypothetical protein
VAPYGRRDLATHAVFRPTANKLEALAGGHALGSARSIPSIPSLGGRADGASVRPERNAAFVAPQESRILLD